MKMRKILNSFRGITVLDVDTPDEEGNTSIDFLCECKICLGAVTSIMNNHPVTIFTFPFKHDVMFSLIFNVSNEEEIYKDLKDIKVRNNLVNEHFSKIDGFKNLTQGAKNKYFRYVKYLRGKRIDGAFILSARQLLENERFCIQCGKELYTKQDEVQAILEFDKPEKVYQRLNSIECADE